MAERIITRIVKRWRVLKAALTQVWHPHTCRSCGDRWVCMAKGCEVWPADDCPSCAIKALEASLVRRVKGAA